LGAGNGNIHIIMHRKF